MAQETSSTGKRKQPGAFTGADDPRRRNGRPRGLPNKINRPARSLLEAHQEETARQLLDMRAPVPHDAAPCPFCKRGMPRDENLIVKVIGEILDRGGTPRTTETVIHEEPDTGWMEWLTDDQIESLAKWIDEARERMPINEVKDPEEPVH